MCNETKSLYVYSSVLAKVTTITVTAQRLSSEEAPPKRLRPLDHVDDLLVRAEVTVAEVPKAGHYILVLVEHRVDGTRDLVRVRARVRVRGKVRGRGRGRGRGRVRG